MSGQYCQDCCRVTILQFVRKWAAILFYWTHQVFGFHCCCGCLRCFSLVSDGSFLMLPTHSALLKLGKQRPLRRYLLGLMLQHHKKEQGKVSSALVTMSSPYIVPEGMLEPIQDLSLSVMVIGDCVLYQS